MKVSETKKVPTIRFKDFEGEWKKTKISSIFKEQMRPVVLLDNKLYELVTIRRRNAGIVSRGKLFGKDILVKSYYQVRKGDFVISKRQVVHGATGIISSGLDGAIVSNEYLVTPGNDYATTEFLFLLSLLPEIKHSFMLSSYGVDIEKLVFDLNDWKKRSVSIPSVEEQRKIGAFFRRLDENIQLHQTKLDKLHAFKQAMLQKMFPQGDATVPEVRFKGFDGAWERKRLGEVADIVGGGTPSTSNLKYWDGEIDWYSPTEIGSKPYADRSVKRITQEGLENSSAKILPAGRTVLFTSRAGIGDMAILRRAGCTNQGFQSFVLHDGIEPYFIYSMGYLIKNYALIYASGSTFLEVSSKQLAKMPLRLPPIEEQRKIGVFFRKLDERISLEYTQLEKLKQIKSACLRGMFV